MSDDNYFHAYYRESGPLPRSACDHALFQMDNVKSGCQFANIDKYLFGLTAKGKDLFKCFLDDPELLASKYGWDKKVVDDIINGAGWTGERLSYDAAMQRMQSLANKTFHYNDGGVLYLFSRNKVNFNVEVYSTKELGSVCIEFLEN